MVKLRWLLLLSLLYCLLSCKPLPNEQKANTLFKGMSQQDDRFTQTEQGYSLIFPHDHGAHADFAIEWWYLTANLHDELGQQYALQWTLFRTTNPDTTPTPWNNNQTFMAHTSLHTEKDSWFEQKFARGGVGNAFVNTAPFNATLDNWVYEAQGQHLTPAQLSVSISNTVDVELALSHSKPLVLHGDRGFSEKFYPYADSEPPASYYYSQPHIKVDGQLSLDSKQFSVVGDAWFDHEWTSQVLPKDASGWDWFALHLHDNSKLMLARVRHNSLEDYWFGSFVTTNGQTYPLSADDISATITQRVEVEGRQLPLQWHIELEAFNIDIHTSPMKRNQWVPGIVAYYEGAINLSGSHSGSGFMELTGY